MSAPDINRSHLQTLELKQILHWSSFIKSDLDRGTGTSSLVSNPSTLNWIMQKRIGGKPRVRDFEPSRSLYLCNWTQLVDWHTHASVVIHDLWALLSRIMIQINWYPDTKSETCVPEQWTPPARLLIHQNRQSTVELVTATLQSPQSPHGTCLQIHKAQVDQPGEPENHMKVLETSDRTEWMWH